MSLAHFKKALRANQTDAEAKLWYLLRDRRLFKLKVRRQEPIGPYIVDFVCHWQKLIVECDGGQHDEGAARRYDERRTDFLMGKGYRVLRFWNHEILENADGVLEEILKYIDYL